MSKLSHGRLGHPRTCDQITVQADQLATHLKDADLSTPVPSCPGWTVNQLVRHLGHGYRWAETTIRTRAAAPPPDTEMRDLSAYAGEDPAVLAPWLRESAAGLTDALRAAGPGAPVWTPVPGETSGFFARRFAHESLVHRADAALALGIDFTVLDEAVAVDAVDEWMELGTHPLQLQFFPEKRELLGGEHPALPGDGRRPRGRGGLAGRPQGRRARLAPHGRRARRARRHRQRPPHRTDPDPLPPPPARHPATEVTGDAALLAFWLDRNGFG
ncbi:hypothetical protein SMD44_06165 [Streptomyces alboflavus]|uniref:Mycothiol-dependent maleylpyruvate isomerase metal-binding domain-containing protein n=1 Tax=Streptomyces alboflavus TaxID=67267 RepID=A0A1Z1WJS1_9ACTN|nr:maleylpyruvate isomerase N-terminal domain-containing protein [Streptomyces alboflavus]ARX86693.1 hypothetical protein SMD44_06165 [Streptomyces alboflavus]